MGTPAGQDDLVFDMAFTEALGGASSDEGVDTDAGEIPASTPNDDGGSLEPQGAEPGTTTPSSVDGGEQPPPAPVSSDYRAQAEELAKANAMLTAQVQELTATKAEAPPAQNGHNTGEAEAPEGNAADPEFEAFAKEWPDVAAMMVRREEALTAKVKALTQALVAPVKDELLQLVQPVVSTHQQTAQDKFINSIKDKHPDVFELLPEVEKWAETLPTYLKVGVAHALKQGTAEDVIALYDSFKEKTGRIQKPSGQALDEVTRHRMRKMGAVSASRPSSLTAQVDANDFEGAFSQAAAEITG